MSLPAQTWRSTHGYGGRASIADQAVGQPGGEERFRGANYSAGLSSPALSDFRQRNSKPPLSSGLGGFISFHFPPCLTRCPEGEKSCGQSSVQIAAELCQESRQTRATVRGCPSGRPGLGTSRDSSPGQTQALWSLKRTQFEEQKSEPQATPFPLAPGAEMTCWLRQEI